MQVIPHASDSRRRDGHGWAHPQLRIALLVALIAALIDAVFPVRVSAQQSIRITGDRLSGSVLPVLPLNGDIELHALRGRAWTVDDTKRLVLEGDVIIDIANHHFVADHAVVWINRLPSADGVINQIAVFFEHLTNPARASGMGLSGKNLLVTGSTRGDVRLDTALLEPDSPPNPATLREAERRLAVYLRRLLGEPQFLLDQPRIDRPAPTRTFAPRPGGVLELDDFLLPDRIELPETERARPWLRDPAAVVRMSYGELRIQPGENENIVTVTDSVLVEYFADNETDDVLQLTIAADRAVLFTEPGPLEEMAAWEMHASKVRGIYLEGNVSASANDGEYIARAPRVYYDFTTDQAIMVDSVLRTYERDLGVAIYARAEEMRQIAKDRWEGRNVQVTTSEFRIGHLSLGAKRMTVTRRPVSGSGARSTRENTRGGTTGSTSAETHLLAKDITLRAGTVPFFYWPHFSGTIEDVPLRGISLGGNDNDGTSVETKWDLFSLLGVERPDGVDAELSLDGYTKRGFGAGLDTKYEGELGNGNLDLYGLHDTGTDRVSTGRDVEPDREFRGYSLWEHETKLGRDWLLQAQASFISDETFMSAWRENDYRERREFETSGYLKSQSGNSAFTVLGKYALNDFLSNDYLLASAGYGVNKLPEITYRRYGDRLFGGPIVHSSEYRVGRMQIAPAEQTPNELGITGRAFGIPGTTKISDGLRADGYTTQWVNRLDMRHEVSLPGRWGIVNVTPFATSRFTAYSDEIEDFSPETDSTRAFGAVGLRLNTQIQRVDNSVENAILDIHRVRHIVEPSLTVWYGASDVSEDDLPVYDLDVESLGTGAVMRVGMRNTLQTQRGGPGRWRSVDFLVVNTDFVFNSNDANQESPSPQFFDYRPEYSQFGDHAHGEMVWLLSDTLSFTGEGFYDTDQSKVTRASIGSTLRHSPLLSTSVEYRFLNASDTKLLDVGWFYRLTPKYSVALAPAWDFKESKLRTLSVAVTRAFPNFDFIIRVRHDDIRDETTLGASIGVVRF